MRSVVYKPSGRVLPASFVESDEWTNLNEIQQQNFCARLNYLEEICAKSEEWLHSQDAFEDTADFLDEVEQDLFINLSSGETDRNVSPWHIHSSWTFGSSPERMLKALPQAVVVGLTETDIGFDCSESEFRSWLDERVKSLRFLLNGFYDSDSLATAVAHIVGMNINLCALLLGVSKQRMNKALSR